MLLVRNDGRVALPCRWVVTWHLQNYFTATILQMCRPVLQVRVGLYTAPPIGSFSEWEVPEVRFGCRGKPKHTRKEVSVDCSAAQTA